MDLRLYDYAASANCYKVRLLLAQLGRPSGAILAYVGDGTAFMPGDPVERAQVMRWLLFEQTGVMMQIGGLRFRLLTGRISAEAAERRRRGALAGLAVLESHLARHEFFVGGRYGIADIAIYGYTHVAGEAGIDLADFPAVRGWCERVAGQERHMNDLETYPANAMAGAGRSIYG